MKRRTRQSWMGLVSGLLVGLAGVMPAAGQDAVGQDAIAAEAVNFERIAVAGIGTWTPEQLERIRSFVELNTSLRTALLELPLTEAESLEGVLEPLLEQRPADVAALVVLYNGDGAFASHSLYRYDERVALVNAAVLLSDDEEVFLRRMEKLTMRGVGLLLDVPQVPNPQSAMWAYRTVEELDWMGRNFDPPSLLKLQENAQALGLPLISQSPFLMLPPAMGE